MPEYKLKKGQERFQVVDGSFEGRKFEPGIVYPEIPPEEARRFDDVSAPVAPKKKGAEA